MITNDMETINIYDSKNSWEVLTPAETGGVNMRRCSNEMQLDHYFGLDSYGQYSYLLRMPERHLGDKEELPKLAGYDISWQRFSTELFFCLTLREKEDYLIFKLLCRIIIDRLESATPRTNKRVLKILSDIFRRCGHFFKKKISPWSHKQARGLVGELVFLLDYVVAKVGWEKALTCWKGPLGAPQDFGIGDSSVEVKTTMQAEAQTVSISNPEQLSPMQGDGYLFVLQLTTGVVSGSTPFTLKDLVKKVCAGFEKSSADDRSLFKAMIRQLGYTETESEANVAYSVVDKTFYALREGFPRITVESLPRGICDCKYSIDLNFCADFIVTPDWIKQ